jgi:hypothetical protein
MTDLEDRLRRDLKELSERAQPGSIRPLRVPSARKAPRMRRWLAPVAATVAVLGVIAGVSLAGPQGGQYAAGRPAAVAGLAGPRPPYYVTVFQRYAGAHGQIITIAAVHDSATGAALTTVRIPTLMSQGGTQGPSITAAGDDRTFVITELGQTGTRNLARFFLLRVTEHGRAASLTRLPITVPGNLSVDDVALSPDGSRLAITVQSCRGADCQHSGIRVVALASGAATTWLTPANGAPFNVSWVGDAKVAFLWQSGARASPPTQRTGYRVLNIDAPGRNLLAARAISSPRAEPSGYIPLALVTLDGNVVITSTVQNDHQWYGRDTVVAEFVELSARTGKLLGVLDTATKKYVAPGDNGAGLLDQECNVVSLGRTGVHVLVQCFGLGFGRLDGSRFTPLPGFPSPSSSGINGQDAAAW